MLNLNLKIYNYEDLQITANHAVDSAFGSHRLGTDHNHRDSDRSLAQWRMHNNSKLPMQRAPRINRRKPLLRQSQYNQSPDRPIRHRKTERAESNAHRPTGQQHILHSHNDTERPKVQNIYITEKQ